MKTTSQPPTVLVRVGPRTARGLQRGNAAETARLDKLGKSSAQRLQPKRGAATLRCCGHAPLRCCCVRPAGVCLMVAIVIRKSDRHQAIGISFDEAQGEPSAVGVEPTAGARVCAVHPYGVATRAGLRVGDVVVSINGVACTLGTPTKRSFSWGRRHKAATSSAPVEQSVSYAI